MKSICIALVVLVASVVSSADCLLAVGGPGLKPQVQNDLVSALESTILKNPRLNIRVFPVSSLPNAVSLNADYIVLVQRGSFGQIRVSLRSLLTGALIYENQVSESLSSQTILSNITANFIELGVPELGSFCFKK